MLDIDLRDYLLRKAYKNGEKCYCFEAIRPRNPSRIFIKFCSPQAESFLVGLINEKIWLAQKIWMKKELNIVHPNQWVLDRNKIGISMNYPPNGKIIEMF